MPTTSKLKTLYTIIMMGSLLGCASSTVPLHTIPFAPVPLSIRLYPRLTVVNSDARLTCFLPGDVGDGIYEMGIVDQFRSAGPIDRLQITREVRIPCEPFTAFCSYKETGKPKQTITENFTPVGECTK